MLDHNSMTMRGSYKVTSNLENGYGRSDITLESLHRKNPHVIIEFKQGTDLERLKNEALEQILEKKYYAPLKGEILCIGLAHDRKRWRKKSEEVRKKSISAALLTSTE